MHTSSLLRGLALSATLLGAAACSSTHSAPKPAPAKGPMAPTLAPASGMDFTQTKIVDFAGRPAGYVVEVLPVPEGLRDLRSYPVGTWLIQDLDFKLVGFISPAGTAYAFDDDTNTAHASSAFGSRDVSLANILKRQGKPTLRDA